LLFSCSSFSKLLQCHKAKSPEIPGFFVFAIFVLETKGKKNEAEASFFVTSEKLLLSVSSRSGRSGFSRLGFSCWGSRSGRSGFSRLSFSCWGSRSGRSGFSRLGFSSRGSRSSNRSWGSRSGWGFFFATSG
jgi:hypothetical protein